MRCATEHCICVRFVKSWSFQICDYKYLKGATTRVIDDSLLPSKMVPSAKILYIFWQISLKQASQILKIFARKLHIVLDSSAFKEGQNGEKNFGINTQISTLNEMRNRTLSMRSTR